MSPLSTPILPRYGFALSREDFAAWSARFSPLYLQSALASLQDWFAHYPDVMGIQNTSVDPFLIELEGMDAFGQPQWSRRPLSFRPGEGLAWQAVHDIFAGGVLARENHRDVLEKVHDDLMGMGAWQEGFRLAAVTAKELSPPGASELDPGHDPVQFPLEAFSKEGRQRLGEVRRRLGDLALQHIGALFEGWGRAYPEVDGIDYVVPLGRGKGWAHLQIGVHAPGMDEGFIQWVSKEIKETLLATLAAMPPSIPLNPFVADILSNLSFGDVAGRVAAAYDVRTSTGPGTWQDEKSAFERDCLDKSLSAVSGTRKGVLRL